MTNLSIIRLPVVVAGFVLVCAPLGAQTPIKVEQIPVYAGAVRQADREAEESSYEEAITVRVYRVSAAVEDVVRFYQQRLSAREVRAEEDREQAYADNVRVGQVSPVVFQVDPVDLSPDAWADQAEGSGRTAQQYAAAVRAAYAKGRTPFRPDTWLLGAYFEWASRESEDRGTNLSLQVQDVSDVGILDPSYHNVVELTIWLRPWGELGWVAEEEEEEPALAMPLAAPSEAELGVPLYPGAQFNGALSGELSASDEEANYYVYRSTDAVATVVSFYRQRTGKQGIENEGGVLIAVRGQGLFPDLAVTVQPNVGTLPATVKTIITVRKRR